MTDIVITDITTGIIDGTGIFDKLMASVKAHIYDEYDNGRIKGPEYSQVYLGAIQAVLAQSVQFALQEKQTEAQVDMILAQTSELLLNGAKGRELTDSQIIGSGYDNQVKEQQVLESTYKVEELLPAELLQLQKQVDVTERGMAEQELTGSRQRDILYVERVIKDKEAAALGLDKVVKVANTPATIEEVYTPKYEE